MKKSILRKLCFAMTALMICPILTACGNSTKENKETEPTTAEAKGASWWTAEQKDTINSLKQCDEDGYFYEMKYLADYDIDKIIESGIDTSAKLRESFKRLYLTDSVYDVPKPIYGGCAGFAAKDADGNQIMGRNYDWEKKDEAALVVHTSPKNGYKSVGMSDLGFAGVTKGFSTDEEKERILYAPVFTTDGINEKGLACTVLILEEKGVHQNSEKADVVTSFVVRLLLDKASTVKEAEELLNRYDIISAFYVDKSKDSHEGKSFHWLVTDKSGDAAVFEFVDNRLVVNRTPVEVENDFSKIKDGMSIDKLNEQIKLSYPKKDTGYQLVTNFYVSEGAENTIGEGYWRFQTLKNNLEKNSHPTKEEAMKYLADIHFYKNDFDTKLVILNNGKDDNDDDQWAWITVWSVVYDTENLSLDICIRENYDKTYRFSI